MQKIVIERATGKAWDVVEEGEFQGKVYYDVKDPDTGATETLFANQIGTTALRDPDAPKRAPGLARS